MAQDGSVAVMGDLIEEQVEQVDNADYNEQHHQQYFECQVTEEVITDDWVQQQGGERVEVPVDQLATDSQNEDIMVPLPTDEYTTLRPYPCDFCSRRFRKKANLMNHMVAHKNDRPNICNLCGARYTRKSDLLDHLKVHAQMPDTELEYTDHFPNVRSSRETDTQSDEQEESISPPAGRKYSRPRKRLTPSTPTKSKKRGKNSAAVAESYQPEVESLPEDIKRLMDAARQHENYARQRTIDRRYPVIDASRPFVCQVCGLSFAREKALTSHSLTHGNDNAYECDSCSDMFWTVEALQEHQRIHHGGQSSNSEYEPEKADTEESETDSKYGDYYCNICGMSFHRIDLLQRHARTHKPDDSEEYDSGVQHCCNVCGRNFAEALDLLAHAEVHARVLPHKCMLCGESFLDENAIKTHISMDHLHELTANTCRLCGKHCRNSRTLMKHCWDHSKAKNHSCAKCGKTFHNRARLKRHMQSHRNKSVTCNICHENFPDGRSLMNHRHSHTNVSGRQFPCNECGKTFGSRSSQQIHMRIHTGERPYGCRFCWKAFADGGTLRKHERIHTGEKPYACPVCPRAFNQRVVLREHIRSHHSGQDPTNGSPDAPYYCSVCSETFKTPQQIIQHLIDHSDSNTIAQRQPPAGPRKYKRRRKLKPDELERLRNDDQDNNYNYSSTRISKVEVLQPQEDDSDELLSDFEDYGQMNTPRKQIRSRKPSEEKTPRSSAKRGRKSAINNDGSINSVFRNLDSALEEMMTTKSTAQAARTVASPLKPLKKQRNVRGASTAVAPASPPTEVNRPRMIHTKKTRVPLEDGKRKARTLITRTETNDRKNTSTNRGRRRNEQSISSSGYEQLENVNIVNTKREHQEYNVNFEDSNLLLELAKKSMNYNPDVVSDLEEILRSPIKGRDEHNANQYIAQNNTSEMMEINYLQQTPSNELITKSTRASKRISSRQTVKPASSQVIIPKVSQSRSTRKVKIVQEQEPIYETNTLPLNIKQEKEVDYSVTNEESGVFTCEMCSAVFSDRAQLLVHVPIHI